MPANFRKLMGEVPRSLEVQARDGKGEMPIGRTRVSDRELARRVEPMLALVASGDIPLDDNLSRAFAAYVESKHGGK